MTLLAVLLEGLFGRLAFGMVSFAFPLYALSLGFSLAEIGVLLSLRSVALLALKPAAGWLTDRYGVRGVFIVGSAARTVAAALLLVSGDFVALAGVRALQGASAAGRDVASLGLIAREAEGRIGSVYGWYATAKHVGGVAGAALAGIALTATGGAYGQVFLVVLGVSLVPLLAVSMAVRDVPRTDSRRVDDPQVTVRDLLRQLSGPASVGLLVATAAYMVHGLFPILATQHAGLSEAQAGIIYSASALVFVVVSPSAGWLVDRAGQLVGLAWRSLANVASSIAYVAFPSFAGLAAARLVDDSGKAAFRPAWAAAISEIARRDPPRAGRRLAALDTAENVGEAIGPLLAGVLWQTGGVVLLFAGRIVLALAAEIAAIRAFGETDALRGIPGRVGRAMTTPTGVTVAHVLPLAVAALLTCAWLAIFSDWGRVPILVADLVVAAGLLALGILVGALAGREAHEGHKRREAEGWERQLESVAHDLRAPLTVIRGEVELVLGDETGPEERRRSAEVVLSQVDRANEVVSRAVRERSGAMTDAGVRDARRADREPRVTTDRLTRTDDAMAAHDAADRRRIGLRRRHATAGRDPAGGPASGDPGVA